MSCQRNGQSLFLFFVGRSRSTRKKEPQWACSERTETETDIATSLWSAVHAYNKVASSSKGKLNNPFKQDLNFENHLIKLNRKHCSSLLKVGLSSHWLLLETGRWMHIM